MTNSGTRVRGSSSISKHTALVAAEECQSRSTRESSVLAIVEFFNGDSHRVHYLRQRFQRERNFGVTSVNYDFAALLAQAKEPARPRLQPALPTCSKRSRLA